ncbi:hypothetical protein D1872_271680 [compost metagenome]
MTSQEFRSTVQYNIYTQFQRPLIVWCHKRIVQERNESIFLRPGSYCRNIGNLERRVGWGLHIDCLGIRSIGGLDLIQISHVHERCLNIHATQNRGQQSVSTAIDVLCHNDMISRREHHEGAGDCSHT